MLLDHGIVITQICKTPYRAIELYSNHRADIVLLDFNWSTKNFSGTELINSFLTYHTSSRVILTTTCYDYQVAGLARKSGARGYLYRNIDSVQNIVHCIYDVHKGGLYYAGESPVDSN